MTFSSAWLMLPQIVGRTYIARGAEYLAQYQLLDASPGGPTTIDGVEYAPHDVSGYSVSAILYDQHGRVLLELSAGPLAGLESAGWVSASATAEQTSRLALPLDVGTRSSSAVVGMVRWSITDDSGQTIEFRRDAATLGAE
jgi:hypothetical protein